jgi:MYXO-CTERM domain-containing protein
MGANRWMVGLGAVAVLLASRQAAASYPAGVWVKVQSVVFEPNAAAPERIQVHGAIMVYDGKTQAPYLGYTGPALGFMYYDCPAGDEATCASEWADIVTNINAPPAECVGLGDQKIATGTLRAPGATAVQPDAYPIAMGVLPGFTPCQIIADFLASGPGAGGAGGEAGSPGSGGSSPGSGGTTSGSGGTSSGSGGTTSSSGGTSSGSGGTSSGSGGAGGKGQATGGTGTASANSADDSGSCSIAAPATPRSHFGLLGSAGLAMLLLGRARRRRSR